MASTGRTNQQKKTYRKGTAVWIPGPLQKRIQEVSSRLETTDASIVVDSTNLILDERVNKIATAFKLSPVEVVKKTVEMYLGLFEDYLHKEVELRNQMTSVGV